MNTYELSRNWFDWCFENTDIISPTHTAMYFFIIEHNNRLGWKEKFGLPTEIAKDALGISNYRTFSKVFQDLIEWGFIILHTKSKNQYSANVIAIAKNAKATTKALDIATQKQMPKQVHGTVCIDKPINKETIEPETIKRFCFKTILIERNGNEKLVSDWMKVRKTKSATNSETALETFLDQVKKSKLSLDEVLQICIERDWKGFKADWVKNLDGHSQSKPTYISPA